MSNWLLVDLDLRLRKIHKPTLRHSRRRILPLLRGTIPLSIISWN